MENRQWSYIYTLKNFYASFFYMLIFNLNLFLSFLLCLHAFHALYVLHNNFHLKKFSHKNLLLVI